MILRAKIPLRISLNGGGTDVDPFCSTNGGIVISSAINKYVYASLEERKDKKVKITSLDYNQTIEFKISDKIALTGNLNLVKATINYFKPYKKGFNLNIHCDAPTGSGLGTSGCLGSMLIKLISKYKKININNFKAAELALKIERDIIKINGGKQDQYAGLFGGFNILNFKEGYKCKVKKIKLKQSFIDELNYNCLLIYTKKKHYSSDLLTEQIKRYKKKIKSTISALKEMKNVNKLFIKSLYSNKIYQTGKLLDRTWELKKKMNPLVTTKEIDALYKDLKRNGILGGKILGAGGGGYMLIILPFFLKSGAIKIIKKHKMNITDFNFENSGLKIWKIKKSLITSNNKKYFL